MDEATEKIGKLSVREGSETPPANNANNKAAGISVPKTPVSLLQELYVRKGITPKYDLVQIEGAVHEPTFKYRVTVGDLVATGSGQSKKKAKHTAAKSMLDRLRQTASQQQQPNGNSSSTGAVVPKAAKVVDLPKDLEAELLSPYDDGISGNPVGDLQEMCMNRRMPPPVYEVGMEAGVPHERSFTIVCSVGGGSIRESGSGKSKKLAKRQAAYKMLQTLKSMPVERDNDPAFTTIDEDDLAQGIAKSAKNGNDDMFKFHRDLKVSKGPHLASLHDDEAYGKGSEVRPEALLDEVSKEQDFGLIYVDVEEKAKNDKYHCFVQMSLTPVAVCFGIGDDPGGAKREAAKNALTYLRIMTKPS